MWGEINVTVVFIDQNRGRMALGLGELGGKDNLLELNMQHRIGKYF